MPPGRSNLYDAEFFSEQTPGSVRSARIVLPTLFRHFKPASVVDIGCGVGTWLEACRELGIGDIRGVDGSYVDMASLLIPPELFTAHDLSSPLQLGRRFDLVVSLEVAEHLPPSAAAQFVTSLASLGDLVLFSAAIPHQFGTGHVNEQWPEYWADLFANHDFVPADLIRPRIWYDERVDWWYRQNILLYVRRSLLPTHSVLAESARGTATRPLSTVHPEHFLALLPEFPVPITVAARDLASAIKGRLIGRKPVIWPRPHAPRYYDSAGPGNAG